VPFFSRAVPTSVPEMTAVPVSEAIAARDAVYRKLFFEGMQSNSLNDWRQTGERAHNGPATHAGLHWLLMP